MWADCVEEAQSEHMTHTKEQMEYMRIDSEYQFVKKRALINFLTNSKLNAEANVHTRTLSMLNQIQNFE
jgi:acyl-CoA thioesterase FadM